jgi:hypothetical protein
MFVPVPVGIFVGVGGGAIGIAAVIGKVDRHGVGRAHQRAEAKHDEEDFRPRTKAGHFHRGGSGQLLRATPGTLGSIHVKNK